MKFKRTVPIAGATGYILLWLLGIPIPIPTANFLCFAVAHNQREQRSDRRGALEGWTWRRKILLSQRHYRGAIENGGDNKIDGAVITLVDVEGRKDSYARETPRRPK